MRTAVHIILLGMTLIAVIILAQSGHAQNETNTTNTTDTNTTTVTNVTLPSAPEITPIKRGEASVSAYYYNNTVKIYFTCYYLGEPDSCPEAFYNITTMNNTVLYSQGFMVNPQTDCRTNICRYEISIPVNGSYKQLVLVYTLKYSDNTTKTYRMILTRQSPGTDLATMIPSLIPLAVTIGLAMQYNIAVAGIGGIASVAIVYLLSVAGVCSFNPLVANITIVASIILIYFSRR